MRVKLCAGSTKAWVAQVKFRIFNFNVIPYKELDCPKKFVNAREKIKVIKYILLSKETLIVKLT